MKYLKDILTPDQIFWLYTSPTNGFGSIYNEFRPQQLLESLKPYQKQATLFASRLGPNPTREKDLKETMDVFLDHPTILITDLLSDHAKKKAPNLRAALQKLAEQPGAKFTKEDIEQLPKNADGDIDDSVTGAAGFNSGIEVLIKEKFRPQMREMFAAEAKTPLR